MTVHRYLAKIENVNTKEIITIGSYNSFATAINMLNKIYNSYINSYINICNKDINIRSIKLLIFNSKGSVVYEEHIGHRIIVTPFMGSK